MHHLKKWICMIAAAALLLSALPAGAESASGARGTPRMTAQRLEEMNGGPEGIHRYGGAVTLLEGRCTEEKITDPDGAARAVESMIGLIGFEIREGEACELPAKGLEGIRVTEVRMDFGEEAPAGAPARKSRPAPRTEEEAPAE